MPPSLAGEWDRFLLTVEAIAGASLFTGPLRGWPDADLIGGQWPALQERFRASLIAVVGAPLFLSWDVRNASASTLPLAAYLNPELVAIHQVRKAMPLARVARLERMVHSMRLHCTNLASFPQDDASASGVLGGAYYYRRVSGGPLTLAIPAAPLATGLSCAGGGNETLWRYTPSAGGAGQRGGGASGGSFESVALPGFCLSAWDLIPGGSCKNPIAAYLLPCNVTGGAGGCPPSAQAWLPQGAAEGWPIAVGYAPPQSIAQVVGLNPFPGPFLSASGVPGALFLQPWGAGRPGTLQLGAQGWATAAAADPSQPTVTTIESQVAGGGCLGAPTFTSSNVWARWLAGGDVALLLVNMGAEPAAVVCLAVGCLDTLSAARGLPDPVGGWTVRDVWLRQDSPSIGPGADFKSPILPAEGGSLLVRLSPVVGSTASRASA